MGKTLMGKVLAGACAVVLAGGLAGCGLGTPALSEVEPDPIEAQISADSLVEGGFLTVAMDAADAPQVLTDAEGKPSGYFGDLAAALAQRLGLKLKVVPGASASATVQEGKADLFFGAKASEAPEGVQVGDSIIEDGSALFAVAPDGSDGAPSVSAADLSGTTIAVQDASASQDALKRNGIEATQKTCENVNACFDALASGEAQYVACDATAGSYLARAYPGAQFVGTISTVSSYGIAMPAASELADAVSAALEDLQADGTLDAIHRSWYGGMPLSLSDTLVSGVTPAAEPGDPGEDGGQAETSGSGDGLSVSEGINSLG